MQLPCGLGHPVRRRPLRHPRTCLHAPFLPRPRLDARYDATLSCCTTWSSAPGTAPWTCNVPDVVFLQGIAETEVADTFRVYFGGADTVVVGWTNDVTLLS